MAQSYQRLVRSVKILTCIFALLFALVGLSIATPNTYAASSPNQATSVNWAGHEANGRRGSYNRGQILFKVPSLQSNGEMSLWIGLGGSTRVGNNYVLVQAGIDTCLGPTCHGVSSCTDPNTQCNYLWWEIAADLSAQPIQFSHPINAGDLIYAYIASDNGTDRFVLQDLTARPSESHTILVTTQGGTVDGQPISKVKPGGRLSSLEGISIPTDGASAECIAERPFIGTSITNGAFAILPKFSSINVLRCDVGLSNDTLLQPISAVSSVNQITMIESKFNGNPRMFAGDVQGQLADSFTLSRA